jgi:hypothetical protein
VSRLSLIFFSVSEAYKSATCPQKNGERKPTVRLLQSGATLAKVPFTALSFTAG